MNNKKNTDASVRPTDENYMAKVYGDKCMEIVKEIMEFADEHGEDRKECFMIVARMLERASNDMSSKLLDLL